MNDSERPFVSPTQHSRPFWEACDRGELMVQRCRACERLQHYPQPMCPACQGVDFSWERLSGRGTIYSYTISRRAFHPYWQGRTPYVLATIELEEGVRMLCDMPGDDGEDVWIGMKVEAAFEDRQGGGKLLRFRAVDGSPGAD